jgi:hypothetical protein
VLMVMGMPISSKRSDPVVDSRAGEAFSRRGSSNYGSHMSSHVQALHAIIFAVQSGEIGSNRLKK